MIWLQEHIRNPGPCGACGKDCADRVTIQEANVDPGHYCDTCAQVEFLNRYVAPKFLGPCECGRPIYGREMDRGRKCEVCRAAAATPSTIREMHVFDPYEQACERCGVSYEAWAACSASPTCGPEPAMFSCGGQRVAPVEIKPSARCAATITRWGISCTRNSGHDGDHRNGDLVWIGAKAHDTAPKPPTLREWLGDRVSELGPWADVLREQPVNAGYLTHWTRQTTGAWIAQSIHFLVIQGTVVQAVQRTVPGCMPDSPIYDALQMALFTRHPAVKSEPAPLRTWFGNEE